MLFVAEILQPEREKSRVALFLAGTVGSSVRTLYSLLLLGAGVPGLHY